MESKHSLRMMKKIMAVLRQPGGSAEAVLALHADPPPGPLTHPQMPPVRPLAAGSRSTAVLADRAGTEEEGEESGEDRGRLGGGGVTSEPHTGVLTGNIGKHKFLEWRWSCRLSLKDLAFLFVFLQGPEEEEGKSQ